MILPNRKQSKCPSADERINKLWYVHSIKYYSAIIKKKIFIFNMDESQTFCKWKKAETKDYTPYESISIQNSRQGKPWQKTYLWWLTAGAGRENKCKRPWRSLLRWGNFLYLDRGSYTIVYIYQNSSNCMFEMDVLFYVNTLIRILLCAWHYCLLLNSEDTLL